MKKTLSIAAAVALSLVGAASASAEINVNRTGTSANQQVNVDASSHTSGITATATRYDTTPNYINNSLSTYNQGIRVLLDAPASSINTGTGCTEQERVNQYSGNISTMVRCDLLDNPGDRVDQGEGIETRDREPWETSTVVFTGSAYADGLYNHTVRHMRANSSFDDSPDYQAEYGVGYRFPWNSVDATIRGNGGIDTIQDCSGPATIYGGAGNDIISGVCAVSERTYQGATTNGYMQENDGDFIQGDEGNDEISAGIGNDTIYPGIGKDEVNSGGGHDVIYDGQGADIYHNKYYDFISNDFDFDGNEDVITCARGLNSYPDGHSPLDTVETGLDTVCEPLAGGDAADPIAQVTTQPTPEPEPDPVDPTPVDPTDPELNDPEVPTDSNPQDENLAPDETEVVAPVVVPPVVVVPPTPPAVKPTYANKKVNVGYSTSGKLSSSTIKKLKVAKKELAKSTTTNVKLVVYYGGSRSKADAKKAAKAMVSAMGKKVTATYKSSSSKTSTLTYTVRTN